MTRQLADQAQHGEWQRRVTDFVHIMAHTSTSIRCKQTRLTVVKMYDPKKWPI